MPDNHAPSYARRLRAAIEGPGMPVLPGAYDGVSARLVAQAGFAAIYFSGGLSASSFPGVPDFGTRTLSEAVAHVGGAVRATGRPVLADGEAGFGSVLSVQRLVYEMESVGAAGLHLEDQDVPRRCGHYEGKRLVSLATHVGRLRAAIETRRDPAFVIIARTDAIAVTGFEDALARARAYVEAGVDVVFFDGVETLEQLEAIPKLIDAPVMANMVEGGVTPFLPAPALEAMGYAIAIYPTTPYFAAIGAMRDVLATLSREGTSEPLWPRMGTFQEWQELTGVEEAMDFVRRFEPEEEHAEL
jgi:2-methylisocitrate lyase-like PEP mutase family enzyme